MTAPTVYHLRNNDGVETFTGTITPAPGGGSQPGAVIVEDFVFTEVVAPGTYTATLDIPAGGWLLDAFLIPETDVWASAGAAINAIDTLGGNKIIDDQHLDGGGTNQAYDPHTVVPSHFNNYASFSDGMGGGGRYPFAAYSARDALQNGGGNAPGVPYSAGTTITMTVITTDDTVVTPTGVVVVRFIYAVPPRTAAGFVAT